MPPIDLALYTLGLLSGLVGTALVWKYGLPAIEVLSEESYAESQITPKMLAYAKRSRLCLFLIGVGFLAQLIALWM
jgi:hypothetical protein